MPLARGREPEDLARVRDEELPNARAAHVTGRKDKNFKFQRYDVGKEDLFQAQHRKCAYCEKSEEQAKYRETEHYRPKSRYWWLAWTWGNLVFACPDCNRGHKREQFPLVDESKRLTAEQAPPGYEQPLLLDPYDPAIVPADHITFRREIVHRRERWRPHGRTRRGTETVRVCGLDRPSLLDLYERHVSDFVRPKLQLFELSLRTEDRRNVKTAWSALTTSILAPGQQFCALSRDAVEVLVPSQVRGRHGLVLELASARRTT